jgi:diguanylate cyclase (GGDEF)-like protein/PAS domain S-box-containing protein
MTNAISPQRAGGNARKRLFFWVVVSILFFTVGLCAICAAFLFAAHNAARERANYAASSLVATIENDVRRNIENVDSSLQAVIDGLKRPDIDRLAPELRRAVLFNRSATARHLGLVIVTDEAGNVRLDSQSVDPHSLSVADRDYFQVHKNDDNVGLYVGGPVLGRITGQASLAISRRLSHPDGSFAGVVSGNLQLQYFKDFFSNISLGPESTVTLITTDGSVLMRWPFDAKYIGVNLNPAVLHGLLGRSRAGQFEAGSELDGIRRLVVYSQIGDLPLVIGVGQSTDEIYSQWRRYVLVLSISGAIFLTVIAILLVSLAREFSLRARYEAGLTAALGNMSQGLCMFDQNQRLELYNDQYIEIFGLPPESVKQGDTFRSILELRRATGAFSGNVDQYAADVPSRLGRRQTVSTTYTLANERVIAVVNCPKEGGGWVATFEDITAQKLAEKELDEARLFLDSIIENIPIAVIVKDAKTGKYLLANRAFQMMRTSLKGNFLGQTIFDIYEPHVAEIMDKLDTACLQSETGINFDEHELDIPKLGPRILNTKRIAVRDKLGASKYLVVVIEDVTEQRRLEKRISFMAHYDVLTGLANRAAAVQKIEEAAARQRRYGDQFSVLLLDLDRFKVVNDTLGHPAGDALLREVATRLKRLLRETDLLGRLGGDEFVIIQESEADLHKAAGALCDRIIGSLTTPFSIDGNDVNIGVSIGIALAPEHATNPDNLLKMADMALYSVKSAGRNGYRFFAPEMNERASKRHDLENDLRRAIQNEEMVLYYQPIVDTRTLKICGAEALIRWLHPTEGIVGPDRFIPLAEETGLITQIGEWVLSAACTEAAAWPADVKLSVNLSPVQFRKSNLPDVVMCALVQSGLSPERLELEITETALIDSAADCLPALRQFKNLGIAIALDDFGTGYSSLSQLTMFPFDRIKIDRSFTQNMTKRSDCAAIIAGTVSLAHSLDIATTAEGVETAEQCRILRLAGVTSLQGYLFKSPGPAALIDFNWVYKQQQMEDAA